MPGYSSAQVAALRRQVREQAEQIRILTDVLRLREEMIDIFRAEVARLRIQLTRVEETQT